MSTDITVKIGGEAGQGIQTVGDLLALVCKKAGLYIMAINDFESRIRGGHSFHQIRISDKPVHAPYHKVHLLVALNTRTFELHKNELESDGLIMTEDNASGENIVSVPITELAKQAGGKITANTVAAGTCLALMGAPLELYKEVLSEYFAQKSEEVLNINLAAAEQGYEAAKSAFFRWSFTWNKTDKPRGAMLDTSKAIALAAVAADCRMAAFYPMSPATGVLRHLNALSDDFSVVVEQAEDEIAAVNMVVGASFAGVRAMTATSGGGFCLMIEGMGLAAITETPLVIVNAQRPGPATGLPTRTAQGDLLFVIRASQDEFPRFVFAPSSPDDAFEITIRAFHLSDKYQVPVIILTDHYLSDSIFTIENPLTVPNTIERFITQDQDIENPAEYKRYAITPDGISPRVRPCAGNALLMVSGNEHLEDGHISEDKDNRQNMVDKRNAKIPNMLREMNPPRTCHENAETLLVGWGSTEGILREAVDMLRADCVDAGCVCFTDIWPFPVEAAAAILNKAKKFFVVEGNSTAQFGSLIREQTGLSHSGAILKYNGRPFFPAEIVERILDF